jgi:hypothetical protein
MIFLDRTTHLPPTRLERWVADRGVPWWVLGLGLLAVFGAAMGGAIVADGLHEESTGLTTEGVYLLQTPMMIAYLFLSWPYLRRWLDQMVGSLRPLVPMDDAEFAALIAEADAANRKTRVRFTIGYTALSYLGLGGFDPSYPAVSAFWLVSLALLCFLISQLIAGVPLFARRLLKELLPKLGNYNLFDPVPLHDVAELSLRVTLVLIGAIVLGELAVPPEESMGLLHLATNGVLVLFALGLHWFNVYPTHLLMMDRKDAELAAVAARLEAVYARVHETLESGELVGEELELTTSSLLALEKRLLAVPDWPQSPAMVVQLLSTTLLPTALGLGKSLLAQVSEATQGLQG